MADWPWQRKKEKEKSGPERAASYCLHERTTEPGGRPHHLSPSWKSRAGAADGVAVGASDFMRPSTRKSTRVWRGAATATPEWNGMGMGIIRGRVPRPLPI